MSRLSRLSRLSRGAGAAIHYETHGQGPAVLLTHGFGLTARIAEP